jgi:hypothetical protein
MPHKVRATTFGQLLTYFSAFALQPEQLSIM